MGVFVLKKGCRSGLFGAIADWNAKIDWVLNFVGKMTISLDRERLNLPMFLYNQCCFRGICRKKCLKNARICRDRRAHV